MNARLASLAFALVLALGLTTLAQERRSPRIPPGAEAQFDVEYGKAGDISLKLDVYRKIDHTSEPMPAVIWIHGGGWAAGDKRGVVGGPELIARGYVVASIDYRLSGVAKFPGCVEDSKCAVRYVRENAKKLGIDPERIGVWGGSAGGHLALMVGCAGEKAGLEGKGGHEGVSSKVACVCSWYGPADFTGDESKFPPGSSKLLESFLGKSQKEDPELYRKASPVTWASKDSPPTLLVHGDKDATVPIEQSELMRAKLEEVGASVKLIRVKNGGHGVGAIKGVETEPSGPEIMKQCLDFFDEHLKKNGEKK